MEKQTIALDSPSFVTTFVEGKVAGQCKEVEMLSEIAQSQSYAAYAAFVHGLVDKWSYVF